MYTLSPFTCARLKRLPKQPVVWEGARRPISEGLLDTFGYEGDTQDEDYEASDCILWVDGTEGVVRAVTIVPSDTGPEAVARTLLQAMEKPQGAMPAARPQKVVVCDREIHFFLRGALQNLDVVVDYAETLPVIDDIFESLQQPGSAEESLLPDDWRTALNEQAHRIWNNAPWNNLGDNQILSIDLNHWDLGTLYVSVLGMAGLEYGLLMYRSLESLTQFREAALLENRSNQQMQQAFLSQDCLFLNFDLRQDDSETPPALLLPWMQSAPSEVVPEFGSLHPLEGLRSTLELEEAAALRICLASLNQFFEQHELAFDGPEFPTITNEFSIENPIDQTKLEVTIQTRPDVTTQLAKLEEGDGTKDISSFAFPRFRDDYVPDGAIVLLTYLPEEMATLLRTKSFYHPVADTAPPTGGLPAIAIQTSRPKAQTLVSQLQAAQGVDAICFSPGLDPMTGDALQLGLMQTGDGDFHLFIEFLRDESRDHQLLEEWLQQCELAKGICGVMIASGVTGAAKGKPGLRETVGFFETRLQTPEALNLPPLQMNYALDWE